MVSVHDSMVFGTVVDHPGEKHGAEKSCLSHDSQEAEKKSRRDQGP